MYQDKQHSILNVYRLTTFLHIHLITFMASGISYYFVIGLWIHMYNKHIY